MTLKPGVYTPEEALAALDAGRTAAAAALEERIAALESALIAPPLAPGQVRQLLAECVTAVKPGEVLVLRCPEGWTPDQAGEMQQHAARWLEENAPGVKVLVVPHLEMAVVQPEPDADLIARIERVWPTLQARNMRRTAMNLPGRARPAYPS